MEQISYKQRICNDEEKINLFLDKQRVGLLAMCDCLTGFPYSVPVNYVYHDGKIYFHGMGSGKKNEMLKSNPKVCFTIFEEYGTVTNPVPAKCDTAYFSVVIFGVALLVEDLTQKTAVLSQVLNKFLPGFFQTPLAEKFIAKYRSSFDNKLVNVYGIEIEDLTAKESPIDPNNMFSNNRQKSTTSY